MTDASNTNDTGGNTMSSDNVSAFANSLCVTMKSAIDRLNESLYLTESEWSIIFYRKQLIAKFANMNAQFVRDGLGNLDYVGKEQQAYGAITAYESLAKFVLQMEEKPNQEVAEVQDYKYYEKTLDTRPTASNLA
jgi:hypothetical protein